MSDKAKRPGKAEANHSCFIAETGFEVTRDGQVSATSTSPYGDACGDYYRAGWGVPIPLPPGLKFPPPDNVTGSKGTASPSDMENWAEESPDDNIGVQMPRRGEWELLGLDVDDYDSKHGGDVWTELAIKHGPLPETYISTRRGIENISGTRFYRVPAGRKWRKAGPDIDTIQHTHRYSAVWPSVVDGLTYRWYFDGDESAVPRFEEIPELPEEWVRQLDKGAVRIIDTAGFEVPDLKTGMRWLADEIPGWEAEPSSEMRRASGAETLEEEMVGGAHDAMLSRLHHVIQLAVEGHHGLEGAIERIKRAFLYEVLGAMDDESTRRDMVGARSEFERAVVGEVSKLQSDIANEFLMISHVGGYTAEDGEIDVSAVLASLAKARDAGDEVAEVDARRYDDNDTGRAEMLLDMLGHRLIAIGDVTNKFAVRLEGRWHLVDAGQVHARLWADTVTASLRATASGLFAEADEAGANGDDRESEELHKAATAMLRRAVKSGDATQMHRGVEHAWKACPNRRPLMSFDSEPVTFGAENGIIDITAYAASFDPDHLLRRSRPEDFVTRSVGYAFDPFAVSSRIERFLDLFVPGLELRRDLFRVLGSMIVTGNPKRHFVAVVGGTSTGKSTLIHWLTRALGSVSTAHASGDVAARAGYVGSGSVDLFGGSGGPNPALLDALRSRILTMSETNSRVMFHGDTLKMLTGGDEIATRLLYSNKVVRAVPQFTPLLVTNQLPTITGADEAVFRRLIVIPFDHAHRDLVDDGEFTDADRSHFLRLVIDGYVDGLDNNWVEASDLCEPIATATETACGELDPLRSWIDTTFVEDPYASVDERVGATEAWFEWQVHEMAEEVPVGERPTRRQLEQRMTERFGKPSPRRRTDGSTKRVYPSPIALRNDDCPAEAGNRRLTIRRLGGDR